MKNRALFVVTISIMIIALLCLSINWLMFSIPDWAVRIIGIVMMVDLVVLTYSTVRIKHKDNE